MKIKLERSGGFTGITSSTEMEISKLPQSLEKTVKELLIGKKFSQPKDSKHLKGYADYLNYKITIQDGKKDRVLECNEFDLDKDVKSLVSYIQKKSAKNRNET